MSFNILTEALGFLLSWISWSDHGLNLLAHLLVGRLAAVLNVLHL